MTRYKVVPPVRDVDFLYDAAAALPLVPGSVEDCCTRLRDRTDLPSRDAAREVLTFLEALGLVDETDRGHHRVRDQPDRAALREAFEDRIFGVEEVLASLAAADRPMTATETFDAVRDIVPRWERSRHADWEATWVERVGRLLEWAAAFDLVRETQGGYEPV